MESAADRYIRTHSSAQSEALAWIERQTNIHTNYPRMLSGAVQGRLLTMLVRVTGSSRILEIGTFTGYSATCLAYGLTEGGHIDTLEINDELEDLTKEGWERAGVSDLITLHIGDARDIIAGFSKDSAGSSPAPGAESPTGGPLYDLVYIDANKREYCQYFDLVLPLVRPGGLILADDVLLGGKVYEDTPSCDKQTQGLLAFNEKVVGDPRVEVVILPIRDGLSLIRKK